MYCNWRITCLGLTEEIKTKEMGDNYPGLIESATEKQSKEYHNSYSI